jgi:cyclohexyl-isocyanide hydratase
MSQPDDLPDFTIAIVLYGNCDLLDVAGPNEVFTFFDGSLIGRTTNLVSVGKTREALSGIGSLQVVPGYDFDDCPPVDLLFVPGGGPSGLEATLADKELRAFLQAKAAEARYVASVCTGGLLLAAAGLLDGYEATTHWAVIDCLKLFPEVKVADGYPRYLNDGNRFTGGGISSSIDLSLFIVETGVTEMGEGAEAGKFASEQIQLQIQYHPQPPNPGGDPDSVDPALLAATEAEMKPFHDGVCAAVKKQLGLG